MSIHVILIFNTSLVVDFLNILSRIQSVCQRVWIWIWPDILSDLIWSQTVCKGYQQTTLVNRCKEGVVFGKVNRVVFPFFVVVGNS